MTPSQFIESRHVEGGLMGGVFLPSRETDGTSMFLRWKEMIKKMGVPTESPNPDTLWGLPIVHIREIEENEILNGNDNAPTFVSFDHFAKSCVKMTI